MSAAYFGRQVDFAEINVGLDCPFHDENHSPTKYILLVRSNNPSEDYDNLINCHSLNSVTDWLTQQLTITIGWQIGCVIGSSTTILI
jgi:hypothetical protein